MTAIRNEKISSRLTYIISVIIFRLSLDTVYIIYLSPAFSNHFLIPFPINFSVFRYFLSFIWIFPFLIVFPFQNATAQAMAFFIFMTFYYVPLASIFGLNYEVPDDVMFYSFVAGMTAYFISTARIGKKKISMPRIMRGRILVYVLIASSIAYYITYMIATGLIFRVNFNLQEIYTFREENAIYLSGGVNAYLFMWTQRIFTPLLLAIGLYRKSFLLVFMSLTLHVFYFSITQHRADLFFPLLVFLAYVIYKYEFSYSFGFIGVSFLVLLAMIISIFLNIPELSAILLRRTFFVGAKVNAQWIEFFRDGPSVYFSDRFLSGILDTPYNDVVLPVFVGDYFSNGQYVAFNSGLVGAGYAQIGLLGVIFYASLLGLIVRFYDFLIRAGVPLFFVAALTFFPIRVAWADSDTLTALLSHGLVISGVCLWLWGSSLSFGKERRGGPARFTVFKPRNGTEREGTNVA